MKIALTNYNKNLSAAYDFADTLTLIKADNNKVVEKRVVELKERNLSARAVEIKNLEVDVLICGCISRCSFEILSQMGIKVISHVSGTIDEIINAYLKNELNNPEFFLPGFGRGKGRRRRCGRKKFYHKS